MEKSISRFIYWTPRILSILLLLFLALFSLDVFEGNYGIWGTILALFMHNIPVFILLILLIIAWKREWVGAIVFILAGMLYIALIFRTILINSPHEWYMLFWSLILSGPAFFIGILFAIGWSKKKKLHKSRK